MIMELTSRRRAVDRCLLALAGLLAPALLGGTEAEAKTPGSTYCFYGTCHRVKTLAETAALVGREEVLSTSFYDGCKNDRYNPCGLTSSGEVFRPDKADNAASPVYPDGTTLLVFNPATKKAAVVRVNNAGPYWGKRKLDVSRATAEKLGFKHRGVASLKVRVVKPPASKAEATYRKHRRYKPVPGFIGEYASAGEANIGMAAIMALEAMATSLLAPASSGLMTAARSDMGDEVMVARKGRKGTRLAEKPMKPQLEAQAQERAPMVVQKATGLGSRLKAAVWKSRKAHRYSKARHKAPRTFI